MFDEKKSFRQNKSLRTGTYRIHLCHNTEFAHKKKKRQNKTENQTEERNREKEKKKE